uniref:Ig-like domain-containing protein n=1 Tax=Lates calcarifer TaxID=8187 RepID=A0A4W6D598_LATCA
MCSCQVVTYLAMVGHDATLSCKVNSRSDPVQEFLEWSRSDLEPKFVHVRRSGKDHLVDQNPSYKGRTSVSTENLMQGDFALQLSNVKPSDEGTYRCFIPKLEINSEVKLVVGKMTDNLTFFPVWGTVQSLPFKLEPDQGKNRVVLHCSSSGWHPEPEVLWLDGEGNLLSAGPTETVRGPDDLYTVSSRVTVEKRHSNSFTCRVQQNNINQTTETEIHIQGRNDLKLSSSTETKRSRRNEIEEERQREKLMREIEEPKKTNDVSK